MHLPDPKLGVGFASGICSDLILLALTPPGRLSQLYKPNIIALAPTAKSAGGHLANLEDIPLFTTPMSACRVRIVIEQGRDVLPVGGLVATLKIVTCSRPFVSG